MAEVEKSTDAAAPVAKIDRAAEQVYAEAAKKVAEPKEPAPAAVVMEAALSGKKAGASRKIGQSLKGGSSKTAVAAAVEPVAETIETTSGEAPAASPPSVQDAEQPVTQTSTNPVIKIKDTIMETVNNTDITGTAKEMLADVQTRAKTAYAKSTVMAAEATEFGKANLEAVVESGKIFLAGAQELLKDNIETGKTVMETVTEDAKKVAAIKSPTELMQLQGEIMRRNFDALVSYGSKRTEAWVKLYNDAFAPISNRVSVAAEKMTKAA